jgi:hypothetical protein
MPDMSETREDHAAVLLTDGNLLVLGSSELEMYDPSSDTWTLAGKMMAELGTLHSATLLADGKVLVVGGQDETDEGRARGISTVEIYDPATFVPEE